MARPTAIMIAVGRANFCRSTVGPWAARPWRSIAPPLPPLHMTRNARGRPTGGVSSSAWRLRWRQVDRRRARGAAARPSKHSRGGGRESGAEAGAWVRECERGGGYAQAREWVHTCACTCACTCTCCTCACTHAHAHAHAHACPCTCTCTCTCACACGVRA